MSQAVNVDWIPEDTFGARLALVRQQLGGWNVKRAAAHCGIEPENWRRWEAGRLPRDVSTVARQIARATGVDYRWLMLGGPLRCSSFHLVPGQGILFSPDPPRRGHLRVAHSASP